MEKFKEVTLWYKEEMVMDTKAEDFEGFLHSGKSKFVFNHLENKHVYLHQRKPFPIKPEFKEQAKEWENSTWGKVSGYLIDGKVLELSDIVVIDENGKFRFIDRDELDD